MYQPSLRIKRLGLIILMLTATTSSALQTSHCQRIKTLSYTLSQQQETAVRRQEACQVGRNDLQLFYLQSNYPSCYPVSEDIASYPHYRIHRRGECGKVLAHHNQLVSVIYQMRRSQRNCQLGQALIEQRQLLQKNYKCVAPLSNNEIDEEEELD